MDALGIGKSIFCERSARSDHEVARRAPSAVDYERIPGLQVSRAEEDRLCKIDGSCAPPDCCCYFFSFARQTRAAIVCSSMTQASSGTNRS